MGYGYSDNLAVRQELFEFLKGQVSSDARYVEYRCDARQTEAIINARIRCKFENLKKPKVDKISKADKTSSKQRTQEVSILFCQRSIN